MHYLYATPAQVQAVEAALREAEANDVTISSAFLGRVVVRCQTEATRDLLVEQCELRAA